MEDYAIFCTRIDLKKNCNVIRFRRRTDNENMPKGMTQRTHLALQLLYFDLFLIKQYNIKINP